MRTVSLAACAAVIALAACSGGKQQQQQASPPPSPVASATATATATAMPAASATPATPDPTAAVAFTDIAGNFAEQAIKQEAALGVFGVKSGKFNPDGAVTRAQYVQWLVTANNIYFQKQPNAQIRLAGAHADQTFADVPKSNPAFAQIQGMADAGYVIGIDKNHFAPDRPLTREELVAIQTARYSGGSPAQVDMKRDAAGAMYCVHLTDVGQISRPYWAAFNQDQCTGFSGQDDLHRIFGGVRTLHPQRPVTRAEVAVALQKIDGTTAQSVLGM